MNRITPADKPNFKSYTPSQADITKAQTEKKQPEQKLENDLIKSAELGKSQINFRGKFFNLNKNDLLFLSTIISGLGLSAAYSDKLKETLSNFLIKNNFKSMSDITSDEHISEQCKLADDLIKALGIDENDEEKVPYLVNRIIERCDSGEEYSPADNIDFIDIMFKSVKEEEPFLFETLKQLKEDDNKLIETIKTTFNLDEKQTKRLNKIIQNTLEDFGYFSLKQLNPEENIEDIGILSDNITDEFKLNEHESLLLSSEILKRIMAIKYTPSINPLDRDKEQTQKDRTIFQQVLNKYNIPPAYYNILYREMK